MLQQFFPWDVTYCRWDVTLMEYMGMWGIHCCQMQPNEIHTGRSTANQLIRPFDANQHQICVNYFTKSVSVAIMFINSSVGLEYEDIWLLLDQKVTKEFNGWTRCLEVLVFRCQFC